MMEIPINGSSSLFCDNKSVVTNSTRPESTLKRKHNSISYHKVRECIAAGSARVGKEDGQTNLADVLTKLMTGPKKRRLCSHIMY